jgi:hypothetical protein
MKYSFVGFALFDFVGLGSKIQDGTDGMDIAYDVNIGVGKL